MRRGVASFAPILVVLSSACATILGLEHQPFAPDDGVSDASTPDGSSVRVCDQPHLFCDDYEQFDPGRYNGSVSHAARLSISTDGGFESGAALSIVTDAVADASNNCYASLSLKLTGTRWRFTFMIRVLEKGLGRYRVADLGFEVSASVDYVLELWLNGPDGKLAIGSFLTSGTYEEYPSTEPTPDDRWHEVSLDVDSSAKVLALQVDRQRIAVPSRSFPLPAGAKNPKIDIGAALVFTPSTTWRVQIDDFRVDALP